MRAAWRSPVSSSISPSSGGGEGLSAQGAAGVRVLAQATRELGQACVGVAGVQHVLGDARVDVEHAPGELGHVPNLSELPLGVVLPRAGGVCEQRLEVGELSAFAVRFVDQRGGQLGLPARFC